MLDQRCGRNLTFRDLIEVGETWQRVRVPNLPEQAATWAALLRLAADVLDPVTERFGPLEITYGFASRALTRHVPRHIDPSRDQHAAHELRADGRPVCARLGQAVDFRIDGLCSGAVSAWIAMHLPFDRLYFYGPDRPVHVSAGPDETRAVVTMMAGPGGRRVPRRVDGAWLVERFGGR